jgi:hypothetical protein
MKKLFFITLLSICSMACKNHQPSVITEAYLPPPPIAKANNEIKEKSENIRLDEPVGNAGTKGGADDRIPLSGRNGVVKDTAKKIIKEGNISFETTNARQTREAITSSLKKAGGYIAEENETNNGDLNSKQYVLKARIPAKNFDTFLNDVSATAVQIDSKNISTRDVTTQYIDMATRLQNKKLLEDRYLSLLKQATRMGDMLQVENKVSEIQSDIESDQGQLNYLSRQVAFSSLDITFYTPHIEAADKGYTIGYKLLQALGQGWETLQGLFFGLIALWPLLLATAILLLVLKRWRMRRKMANAQ